MICTFCHISPLSFAPNGVTGAASSVHTKGPENMHPFQKNSYILVSSPHTFMCTHAAGPSHPHPLSSQRHKDIFIFHKAQTLMKHQRHIHFHDFSNVAPAASAVTHRSISVCCCECKLSQCMRVKMMLVMSEAV